MINSLHHPAVHTFSRLLDLLLLGSVSKIIDENSEKELKDDVVAEDDHRDKEEVVPSSNRTDMIVHD